VTLRKIAIFPNSEYDREYAYTGQAVRVLSENGILSILSSSAKPFFKEEHLSVQFFDEADAMMDACDAILVLGGDGTMIDYSVRAAEKNKPAIGINLGHLGFLMALERTEIDKLALLATDDFTVESRMLLDAEILLNGERLHSQRILNDIVVASGVRSKIAEFSLFCTPGGKLDYRADGIIVATPTGSTAYSFSAGGPVLQPDLRCILLTPVCPHALSSRQVVFGEDAVLSANVLKSSDAKCYMTVDGQDYISLSSADTVTIRKSPRELQLIILKEKNFYTLLNEKLKEN
jgi:NAD+ kinase